MPVDDPMLIAAVLAAFVCVAAVGWVIAGSGDSSQTARKRAQSVTGRARLRGKRQTSALDAAAQRRKQVQETLKELEERQKTQRKRAVTLKARIAQAGLEITPRTFWIASLVVGLGVLAALFVAGRPPWIAAAGGFAAGLGAPRWFLTILRKRRMKKFSADFANSIDVIVRGVKSGLPLNDCLRMIATEAPEPICSEFQSLTEGLSMGVPLDEGLRRMYERMPLSELNFFGVVLAIQQKSGGNLAEALNNLSVVLRSRKMMREKIQALSSEAKASAMIIGSLPPGVMAMVYFTTPTYMTLLFTDPTGKMMLLGGGTWMAAGIFIMRRMINFKI